MYGYGYGYGYYGFDWTYILLIIGMLLSLAASTRLKSTFSWSISSLMKVICGVKS